MYVIPQAAIVRDPDRFNTPLPPEGAEVPDCRYWRRRLLDGSVVIGTPPAPKQKSTPKKPEADDN